MLSNDEPTSYQASTALPKVLNEYGVRFHNGRWAPDPERWCKVWNVPIVDGKVRLYKATDMFGRTGEEYGFTVQWRVGQTVTCTDWSPTPNCGGGLHLWPTLDKALDWVTKDLRRNEVYGKIFAVEVNVTDMVPIAWPFLSRTISDTYSHEQRMYDLRMWGTDGVWSNSGWVEKVKVRSCTVIENLDPAGTRPLLAWRRLAAGEVV